MGELKDSNYSQTLGKALEIMELFKESAALSLTDITKQTRLGTSVAYRLLYTLCKHGYLAQASDKTYSLSENAIMLGMAGLRGRKIVRTAHSLIWDWYLQTGHTVGVSIVIDRKAVIVDKINPLADEVDMPYIGRPLPLHKGATQRVLLAFLPDEDRKAYLDSLYIEKAAKKALIADLEKIRKRGYDYTSEQVTKGIWAVAFPIFESSGALAGCIGTSDYVSTQQEETIEQRMEQLKQLVSRVQQKMNMA